MATNTHTGCVIFIVFFPPQQWLYERASMLRHTMLTLFVSFQSIIHDSAMFDPLQPTRLQKGLTVRRNNRLHNPRTRRADAGVNETTLRSVDAIRVPGFLVFETHAF